ncbi:molybdopterin molybdotransferase [Actinacidiphila yanglinensis]|uniref:Molybdopterin molybdenumtransferase n=1 Tax=Actinacidiphila yanglinensis TaxID=310779 RepID=A0A1H6CNJ3_9ACTN|nr:molybdopterin molybdotransferase MoeA [Actinacidiphila yanglinensis]SEG74541.1 molybdopterin molybdotransferase [Actinacidiphila yanglinensis]
MGTAGLRHGARDEREAGGRPRPGAAVPWEEARRAATEAAVPLPAREVPLKRARGRALAAPLIASLPHPAFDTAAMDGYAVAGDPPWTVVGRVPAGREPGTGAPLAPGRAVEIATGAPTPPGTLAVLPYELSDRDGGTLRPARGGAGCDGPGAGRADAEGGRLPAGRNVRRRGEECPAGCEVLPAGALVTPAVLGLAASLGHDVLPVHGCPRVAVVVTGDELVRAGLPPAGRVRDALGPLLPGLVEWAGGRPLPLTCLPDGRGPLVAELARAAGPSGAGSGSGPGEPWPGERAAGWARGASGADVVVVCGASSRGPADHLRPALRELGAEFTVDAVACRPGHPQLLARLPGGPFVVGLPGNPYAALAAALTLLVPLLGGLSGRAVPVHPRARLTAAPRIDAVRTRLVPVTVQGCTATPVGHDRPALLWGASLADALAVVPPGGAPAVELLPLPR